MNTTTIPTTVVGNIPRGLYEAANQLRADIKAIAARAEALRKSIRVQPALADVESAVNGEVIANAALAYRHLEDASMRFGKMMQALDGGVSVYDKATTVGAVMDKEG
jgi:hypothetical protein